jgi:hypothetical protein
VPLHHILEAKGDYSSKSIVCQPLSSHTVHTQLTDVDSNMSSSTDMTNIDDHLSATPPTYQEQPQPRQLQPAAIQRWLEESPHEEPWTTYSLIVEELSISEAQNIPEEMERDIAQGIPHRIDNNSNRSADTTDTAKPLSSTHPTSHEQPQPRQLQPAAIQEWLKENPNEGPWFPSHRTNRQCPSAEAQRLLEELEQEMALDMTRR